MTRISRLFACACAGWRWPAEPQRRAGVGVSEDAGKSNADGAFFATLNDIGLTAEPRLDRLGPREADDDPGQAEIAAVAAAGPGGRHQIVFAVSPEERERTSARRRLRAAAVRRLRGAARDGVPAR